MLKVVVACGSGMGSSMMMKMKLEKVLKEMGITAIITHTNVGDAKSSASNYNLVVTSDSLRETLKSVEEKGVALVSLKNLLDENELKSKLEQVNVAELDKKVNV